MKSQYEQNGYHLIQSALSENDVTSLIKEMSVFNKEINNYGIRNLMSKVPYVRSLALSPSLLKLAIEILGEQARPIRSVFFDKVPEANWNVAWHQDTSIVVKEKKKCQVLINGEKKKVYLMSSHPKNTFHPF